MLPTPVLGSQGWGNPWGSLAGQPGIFDELQASEQACVTKRDGQTVSVEQWSRLSSGLHMHGHT